MAYLIPSLYLLIYAIIHSLLATIAVKNKIAHFLPHGLTYYRLIYTILSLFLLMPLPFLPWPTGTLYTIVSPWSYLFYVIRLIGLIGFLWTLRHIDLGQFLGWSQNHTHTPERDEDTPLITSGPYRLCRHPLYFFISLALIGNPHMTDTDALLTGWTVIYFYIGSYFEERRLHRIFGPVYQTYCQNTPRLLPYK